MFRCSRLTVQCASLVMEKCANVIYGQLIRTQITRSTSLMSSSHIHTYCTGYTACSPRLISKPGLDKSSSQDMSFYWSFRSTPLLVIPMPWILRTCFLSESLVLETEPHRLHDMPGLSMCFDSIWVLRFCFLLKKAPHSLQLKPPWALTIIWRTAASVTSGRKITVDL